MKKITTELYIKRAKEIYGDKYNYNECVYVNMKTKVKVKCVKHDSEFNVSPVKHLANQGCPSCTKEKLAKLKQVDTPGFIERAIAVHGHEYDYSKVNYVNNTHKVEIICRLHGGWYASPNNHTSKANKNGCPECAKSKMGPNKKTTEWFVQKAIGIHGDTFDYSRSKYIGCLDAIEIECRKHGIFAQKAYQHFATTVCCPLCTTSVSKGEIEWLNYLGIPDAYRQKRLFIEGKMFSVDAIDYRTNTIYEFYGDYWHGNPNTMDSEAYNDRAEATFGELYEKTKSRAAYLMKNGYNIVAIWEHDWNNLKLQSCILNTSDSHTYDI